MAIKINENLLLKKPELPAITETKQALQEAVDQAKEAEIQAQKPVFIEYLLPFH